MSFLHKNRSETVYQQKTDRQLLHKISLGDGHAFDELYYRYVKQAYSRMTYFLHNEEDAKELIQMLFADIWAAPEAFKCNDAGSLSPFFYASLDHRCLSFLKKRNRCGELPDADLMAEADCPDSLERQETIKCIRENLPNKMADLVILHLFDEWDFESIAMQLNITPDAASSAYRRALIQLKQTPKFMDFMVNNFKGGKSDGR